MVDCEICLRPTIDPIYVTFDAGSDIKLTVAFCRDCITTVFKNMAERYKQAVDENNRAVDGLLRTLGIDNPFYCGHGRSGTEDCPFCNAGIETAMCTTLDHEDFAAVGDALSEEPDQDRYPYCAACLDALESGYDARRW